MTKNRLKQYNDDMVDFDDPAALTSVPKAKAEAPQPSEEPKKVEEEKPVTKNPLDGMIETKPKGKSYGFYLSSEAVEKLERLAKQNGCSTSKALDLLLKSVL